MKGIFDKMEAVIREIADAECFNFVFEQQNAGLIVRPQAVRPHRRVGAKLQRPLQGRGRHPPPTRRRRPATRSPPPRPRRRNRRARVLHLGGPGGASRRPRRGRRIRRVVERVMSLDAAGPSDISFYANRRYRADFQATRAAAVIVGEDEAARSGPALLRAANPYLAFAKVSTLFHPPREPLPEIAPGAVVHESARVHPSAQVMPLAYVGPGRPGGGAHHPLPRRGARRGRAGGCRLRALPPRRRPRALRGGRPLHPAAGGGGGRGRLRLRLRHGG